MRVRVRERKPRVGKMLTRERKREREKGERERERGEFLWQLQKQHHWEQRLPENQK